LFKTFQIRDESVDIVELTLRHAGHGQLAHCVGSLLSTLADGVGLDVQLLLDELFQLGDTFALFRHWSGEGLKVPRIFGHLFHDGTVGLEIGFVAGDQITAMAAFRRDERFFDRSQQLNELMACGVQTAVFHHHGGVPIRHDANKENAGEHQPEAAQHALLDGPLGQPGQPHSQPGCHFCLVWRRGLRSAWRRFGQGRSSRRRC
jgi:hypothetical protein